MKQTINDITNAKMFVFINFQILNAIFANTWYICKELGLNRGIFGNETPVFGIISLYHK